MSTLSMRQVSAERDGCGAAAGTRDGLAGLEDAALLRIVRGEPLDSPARAGACEVLLVQDLSVSP